MLKKITLMLCSAFLLFNAVAEQGEENIEENLSKKIFNPEIQRTFVMTAAGYHMELNPHLSSYSNEAQIINGLQEGLFSYDPKTLDPVPALAESFKISRDKKRWTFTIRQNAKLSDGTPVTPQTIIDSWLLLQSTPEAPYASLLDCITGIKEYRESNGNNAEVGLKASGQNLIVTLKTPTAHLPRLLCHHAFSVYTGSENVFSGAFKLESAGPEGLKLVKNECYWDAENVALNEILINFSDNKSENTWLYNTGRTDWVVSSVDTERLLNKNAIKINTLFGTSYLFFTCRNKIWDNADFRNALIAAVPWEALRKDNLIQASTLVYPLTGYPEIEGLTDTNEDEAAELMAQARKKAGIDPDKKLELTFGIARNEYMMQMAELLKSSWEKLGVTLYPMRIDENDYLANIPYLNYDLFSYSWIGDFADPVAFLELFREGSTLNQTKWINSDFTKTMNESDAETDPAQRYKLLAKAEQILIDDGIILPIGHSISLHAINLQQIGGWYSNALDIHPLKTIFFTEYQSEQLPNIVKK